MRSRTSPHLGLLLAAALSATASTARADPHDEHHRISLRRGQLQVGASLEVGLDARTAGEPVALAPDLWLGITDRLTLGLAHSGRALGRLDSGRGFCFTGPSGGCPGVYGSTWLDGRYTFLHARGLQLAARARFGVAQYFERLKLRMTLGVQGHYRAGPFLLRFAPTVEVGLTHRDQGNGDRFNLPVQVGFALGPYVELYLRTGLQGLLSSFADQLAVPVGLGVAVRPAGRWQLGVEFSLRQLFGPQNTHLKRDLLVYADYRFGPLF